MVRSPSFSIVTATYNPGALLDRTIASLQRQRFRDFEWIVIDGGSTDGTQTKLRKSENGVDQWVSEPDKGIADAWNKGLARASGNNVLMLCAGDTYDPEFLEQVYGARARSQAIVCSHVRLMTEAGVCTGLLKAEPRKLNRGMHVPHGWCAVPRAFYLELGGYRPLPVAMDFEWFHRYYLRYGNNGFAIINETLGSFYLGGTSDKKYSEGFKANEQIIVENGGNPVTARALRLLYTLNHFVNHRFVLRER